MGQPLKGDKAPGFSIPATSGEFRLEEALSTGRVVLAFYTEDDTPGCNQELTAFKAEYDTLEGLGAQMVGISADGLESHRELEQRLKSRAQDSDEVVARRMSKAADEISHWPEYDYVVVNQDMEGALGQVRAILTAERLKRARQTYLVNFVKRLQDGQ